MFSTSFQQFSVPLFGTFVWYAGTCFFDVEYDRKTKLYHLKNGYKKIFVSIDNQTKVCTKQVTANQQLNTEKTDFWWATHQTTKSDEIGSLQPELQQPILDKILSIAF